jgi:hypothetical protein
LSHERAVPETQLRLPAERRRELDQGVRAPGAAVSGCRRILR